MAHLEDWHRRVGWSRGSMSRPSSPLFSANIHGIFLHKPELGTGSFFRAIASFEKGAFSFARLTEALHLQCTYIQAQSSVQGLSCLHSGTCTYEYSTLRCICTQQECNTLICSFPQFYHYGMMTIPCFLHSKKGLKRNNAIKPSFNHHKPLLFAGLAASESKQFRIFVSLRKNRIKFFFARPWQFLI